MSTFFEHQQRAVMAFGGNPSDIQQMISPDGAGVLDLALPKPTLSPPSHMETPMIGNIPLMQPTPYGYMPRVSLIIFIIILVLFVFSYNHNITREKKWILY